MAAEGLVALPGSSAEETLGGWNRWVENSCENDWDVFFFNAAETTPTAISSEIDWMRFFWEFLTSQDEGLAPQPGFADVIRILAHTDKNNSWGSIDSVWELMVLTMDEDEEFAGLDLYLERFEALNATHGVFHDPSL